MIMPMTKADFAEIAEAVAEAKRVIEYHYRADTDNRPMRLEMSALETATKELATACARRYKGAYGFNRSKFVEACGFPDA
jgi:hypothetical protein